MDIQDKTEAVTFTAGAASITIWGMTLNDVAALLAITFTIMNIIVVAPRFLSNIVTFIDKVSKYVSKK